MANSPPSTSPHYGTSPHSHAQQQYSSSSNYSSSSYSRTSPNANPARSRGTSPLRHNPLPRPPAVSPYTESLARGSSSASAAAAVHQQQQSSYAKRVVRAGYWNRRGDHLYVTDKGERFIVYAPHHLANPEELKTYPSPTEGWRDHRGDFIKYDGSVPELLDSLPLQGRSPLRPYSSVSCWFSCSSIVRSSRLIARNTPAAVCPSDRVLKPNSAIVVSWPRPGLLTDANLVVSVLLSPTLNLPLPPDDYLSMYYLPTTWITALFHTTHTNINPNPNRPGRARCHNSFPFPIFPSPLYPNAPRVFSCTHGLPSPHAICIVSLSLSLSLSIVLQRSHTPHIISPVPFVHVHTVLSCRGQTEMCCKIQIQTAGVAIALENNGSISHGRERWSGVST